ncbi:cell wall peptidase, M23 family [Myxococcus xanthus DK 1622]|uniref:Cell wall peptidase, M23 family n=1 Tax=Myxococcus xanthus (strain DK1622) TaxID=246197 RepID=Q1D403_MYXXD|nr:MULTISPECIES: M23 family metallopeptidase [Myxococcus]ABF88300.1 cell wall peptidase, M23 family [Myxococcus xanthus DK 1622]NOJ50998.1 M23 family metallopeptidase [Myxococcus xanthus]QPM77030.1 M23 family metallopeptidase [Myxococcus xanthus]QVW66098.1 M23 family metallopeptidase [Myxococcus xanthus DZ2]UEO07774.1 M23 family metallopeptidase [Myxococcus xanthus DZ2]
MAPCVSSRARGALRVFLLAVLLSGCVGTRASSVAGPDTGLDAVSREDETAEVTDAAERTTPLPFSLRGVHDEPELVAVRHLVAPGETMYRISRTYGLTVEELGAANGIKAPWALAVGQELSIPGVERSVPVRALAEADPEPVRTSTSAGGRRSVPTSGRREEPPSRSRSLSRPASAAGRPRVATQGQLDWPMRGVLYGRFGKKGKEPHDGIDLAAPSGTPVKTAQEGTVLYAGEQRGYGNIVIVEHTNKLITLYAHNRDLRVRTGQKVRREQVIATVGESGRTSGPHLHFEVRLDGKPVDPLDFLGPMPSS